MPVLIYNACTWAISETELKELNAFHRKQLRSLMRINYPRIISNQDLYKKCDTSELTPIIRAARWRMLGHVLRMADDTPAKYATIHFFDQATTAFKGRPITTLATVMNDDLELAKKQQQTSQKALDELPKQLKKLEDIKHLEKLAKDRSKWSSIVANMQVLTPPQPKPRPRRNVRR